MTERDNKTSEDWFQRLKKGLDKSTNKISSAISNAFLKQKIDDDKSFDLNNNDDVS